MKACAIFFVIVAASISTETVSAATKNVICYHGSWSAYRNGNGKFAVEDIDPTLCTHLIYTFVGLNEDGTIKVLDDWLEISLGNFKRFNDLKQKNKNLKTSVAIGGWNEGSERYSRVAADPAKRATLIQSALSLVQTYGFDGFDIDWEYPAQRGGAPADKANYVKLIQEFRAEWDKHGLILTAAVAASGNSVDLSYDVPSLSKYLDFINVMAYDLHGSYDGVTGQNAPLYASSIETSASQKLLNVDACIRGWISRGADPQKIALGLGMYGRSYTLSNKSNNKLGALATIGGTPGPYTQETGMLGYNEICENIKKGGWTVVWDDQQKVPYAYTASGQWVGYDNPKSIGIKVEFAKSLNLGAVMIWSIETEDFKGICGPKYPLLNAINTALGTSNEILDPEEPQEPEQPEEPQQPEEPEDPQTPEEPQEPEDPQTPEEPQEPEDPQPAPQPNSGNSCVKEGYVRDPKDCNKFFYCLPNGSTYVQLVQYCNAGLYYDEENNRCDWPQNVTC